MEKVTQKVKELLEELIGILAPAPSPRLVPIPVRTRDGYPRSRR